MYWIILCALAACVSSDCSGESLLNEKLYRGDSNEADSITYHSDDNAHLDIKSDHDMNKYFNYVHKREHGLTKQVLQNSTNKHIDFTRLHALRVKHKRRCEMSVTSIIEKEKYCQVCTCYLGQWVCVYATSCYYKYDFSNNLCKKGRSKDVKVYFQKDCFVCACEAKTNLMRCVRNAERKNEEYCKSLESMDVLGGE